MDYLQDSFSVETFYNQQAYAQVYPQNDAPLYGVSEY